MSLPRHGTYARYNREAAEQRENGGDPPCDRCKAAKNKYQQERRAKGPGTRKSQKDALAAHQRALSRLAEMHPDDYARLLAQELPKKLPPVS